MALKLTISKDEHAKLDDPTKALYAPAGEGFRLDVEGGEDAAALKAAYERTKEKLKALDGVDPVKYKEALAKLEEMENERNERDLKEKEKRGDYDARNKQLLERFNKDLQAKEAEVAAAKAAAKAADERRQKQWMNAEATAAISAVKGNRDLLLPLLERLLKVVDIDGNETLEIYNLDGSPYQNGKAKPTVSEFLEELKQKPQYAGAFEGTRASGGGTQPSRNGASGNIVYNREDMKDPAKYRAARDQAAKEGRPFMIEGQANLNEG